MPSSPLYLKTAQAAAIAGVPLSTIYTAYNRHGHWEGITPRKNPSGRLIWPATEVRARFTQPRVEMPGLEEFVSWAQTLVPELDPQAVAHLGRALLGSEGVLGWQPSPGQFDEKRLHIEAAILGLAVQAWVERRDQACVQARAEVAGPAHDWLAHVIRSKLRVFEEGVCDE